MGDQRRYNTHAASAAHSAMRSIDTTTTTRAERRCSSEPGGNEGALCGGGTDAWGSGRTPADGKIDPLPRARAGMTALASTCGYGPLELESAA